MPRSENTPRPDATPASSRDERRPWEAPALAPLDVLNETGTHKAFTDSIETTTPTFGPGGPS